MRELDTETFEEMLGEFINDEPHNEFEKDFIELINKHKGDEYGYGGEHTIVKSLFFHFFNIKDVMRNRRRW